MSVFCHRSRFALFLAVALLAALLPTFIGTAGAVAQASAPPYLPPVDAPVIDGFRPPATPYGPGNRGLEYGPTPGTAVRAAGDGTVEFAGRVANTLHVVIRHADGLRTDYSFLATVAVERGARLAQGDPVGTAGAVFHFGVRFPDGSYLDPSVLFAGRTLTARLAPSPWVTAAEVTNERALARIVTERMADLGSNSWLATLVRTAESVAIATVISPIERVRLAAQFGIDAASAASAILPSVVDALTADANGPCTAPGTPVLPVAHPERRVVILVAGLTTSTKSDGTVDAGVEELDLAALGYDPARVVRFSYNGGRTPASVAAAFAGIPASAYTAADTEQPAATSARHLGELIRQVRSAEPGAEIDLIGHSLGGLLAESVAAGPRAKDLSHVILLGAPVAGAELASVGGALDRSGMAAPVFRSAVSWADLPALSGAVLDDLAPGSAFLADLGRRMASPAVPGVPTMSISAAGDLVVPAARARVPGAANVVEPIVGRGTHGDLPGSSLVQTDIGRLLNGQAPDCRHSFGDRFTTAVLPHLISLAEDSIGLAVTAASASPTGP